MTPEELQQLIVQLETERDQLVEHSNQRLRYLDEQIRQHTAERDKLLSDASGRVTFLAGKIEAYQYMLALSLNSESPVAAE